MSRPSNFIQLCTCGHYGNVHDEYWWAGCSGHGPCAMPGCTCSKFTWVEWREEPCECGHLRDQHYMGLLPNDGEPGHGNCSQCQCAKFTPTQDRLPLTDAIAPDDNRSWCSRCGGRDPDCYICGIRRREPL